MNFRRRKFMFAGKTDSFTSEPIQVRVSRAGTASRLIIRVSRSPRKLGTTYVFGHQRTDCRCPQLRSSDLGTSLIRRLTGSLPQKSLLCLETRRDAGVQPECWQVPAGGQGPLRVDSVISPTGSEFAPSARTSHWRGETSLPLAAIQAVRYHAGAGVSG